MGLKDALWSAYGKAYQNIDGSKRISPPDAAKAIENGEAVLIDVRERGELGPGIAEPARWFATSLIQQGGEALDAFCASLPKDKLVILYCAAGVRSGRAATKLSGLGFETANVGGYKDWVSAALPIRAATAAELG